MNFIPDVFVIGAMKAGTTTIHNSFRLHPSICVTKTKEVNYFLEAHTPNSLNALYRNEFRYPDLLKVDVSPSYSKCHFFPGVASRIYAANPKAKIIYVLRDPVDRLVSHLHHNLLRDRFSITDMEQEIFRNVDYISSSRYYFQIREYLNFFDTKNILILIFEDFINRPQFLVDSLCSFLGIEANRIEERNQYASESRYKIKYHDTLHRYFGHGKLAKLYHLFWYLVNIKVEKPQLNELLRSSVVDDLKSDVESLSSEFKISFPSWRNFT